MTWLAVPLYAHAQGMSNAQIGALFAAPVLAQAPLNLVGGASTDRIGGTVLCGFVLAAAGFGATFLVLTATGVLSLFAGLATPRLHKRHAALSARHPLAGYLPLLRRRIIVYTMLCAYLSALPFSLTMSFYPLLFARLGACARRSGLERVASQHATAHGFSRRPLWHRGRVLRARGLCRRLRDRHCTHAALGVPAPLSHFSRRRSFSSRSRMPRSMPRKASTCCRSASSRLSRSRRSRSRSRAARSSSRARRTCSCACTTISAAMRL